MAGLDEPLLGAYDEEAGEDGEGGEGDDKFKKKGFTKMDGIVGLGLTATAAITGLAMTTVFGPLGIVMYVAGAVTFATIPLVAWQRTLIVDTRGLRDFINEIRSTVNEFAETNQQLSGNIDELETQTDRLKVTEQAFADLAEKNGQDVGKLVELVKENGENIKKMKSLMKGDISQLLISTVMAGDMNQDFKMDPREVEFLMLRLQQVEFIEYDEPRLRAIIEENDGEMECVMRVALEIFDEDIPEDSKIFKILEPEKPKVIE